MTTWTCVRCGRPADWRRLTTSVDPNYRFGYCLDCKFERYFRTTSGETLKQRGMALAESAEADWSARADAAIAQLAQRGTPFSAEDVCEIAGRPSHANAVGARMNAAARRGVIVKVGYAKANRPERHANEMARWQGA